MSVKVACPGRSLSDPARRWKRPIGSVPFRIGTRDKNEKPDHGIALHPGARDACWKRLAVLMFMDWRYAFSPAAGGICAASGRGSAITGRHGRPRPYDQAMVAIAYFNSVRFLCSCEMAILQDRGGATALSLQIYCKYSLHTTFGLYPRPPQSYLMSIKGCGRTTPAENKTGEADNDFQT
jgi:hypothetical protein